MYRLLATKFRLFKSNMKQSRVFLKASHDDFFWFAFYLLLLVNCLPFIVNLHLGTSVQWRSAHSSGPLRLEQILKGNRNQSLVVTWPAPHNPHASCAPQTMPKTLNPQWREQFDFHLYEENGGVLEITVWDKDAGKRDDFIGRWGRGGPAANMAPSARVT